MTAPEDELSEEVLEQDIETMNNVRSVSKELFSKKNIAGKTELSAKQINAIARVAFMNRWLRSDINEETGAPITVEENFTRTIEEIELLSASHNRKSRDEFVESMKIQNAQANKETFLGNLGNKN